VVGVMDSSGNLIDSYVYDPFGNLFEQNESVANPWQYASGYLDGTTGLYHFGARYYDPTLGRWTQQDPVAPTLTNPDSLNRYLYVDDSPVNLTDQNGRDFWSCVEIGFGLGLAAWGLYAGLIGVLASFIPGPWEPFTLFLALVGLVTTYLGAVLLYNGIRSCLPFLHLPPIWWLP